MRYRRLLGIGAILLLNGLIFGILSVTALASPSTQEVIDDAAQVVHEMSLQDDVETMARLAGRAVGIAVFPRVIKAGLVIGGSHGNGLALRRDPQTGAWYGPSFIEITGLSWGAQIGVQSTALVLAITNEQGMRVFNGDKVTLGGEFSVAAGPVGRQAQAGTDTQLSASIYSYSINKGIFIGFSLSGAKIDDDPNANQAYWGATIPPRQILAEKSADARVKPVVNELMQLIAKAK